MVFHCVGCSVCRSAIPGCGQNPTTQRCPCCTNGDKGKGDIYSCDLWWWWWWWWWWWPLPKWGQWEIFIAATWGKHQRRWINETCKTTSYENRFRGKRFTTIGGLANHTKYVSTLLLIVVLSRRTLKHFRFFWYPDAVNQFKHGNIQVKNPSWFMIISK